MTGALIGEDKCRKQQGQQVGAQALQLHQGPGAPLSAPQSPPWGGDLAVQAPAELARHAAGAGQAWIGPCRKGLAIAAMLAA